MPNCRVATFTSNSAAETEAIAREIAAELRPGDIVALQGELGAGKTHFTKGLVSGLASPAVTIDRVHASFPKRTEQKFAC